MKTQYSRVTPELVEEIRAIVGARPRQNFPGCVKEGWAIKCRTSIDAMTDKSRTLKRPEKPHS